MHPQRTSALSAKPIVHPCQAQRGRLPSWATEPVRGIRQQVNHRVRATFASRATGPNFPSDGAMISRSPCVPRIGEHALSRGVGGAGRSAGRPWRVVPPGSGAACCLVTHMPEDLWEPGLASRPAYLPENWSASQPALPEARLAVSRGSPRPGRWHGGCTACPPTRAALR